MEAVAGHARAGGVERERGHAPAAVERALDEADGLGAVLGVASRAGRPISYLTTGQGVPDDIEPADRDRLAALILGQEAVR